MRGTKKTTHHAGKAFFVVLALLSVVGAALTACGDPTPESGVVTGHVSVQPLSPVEEEGAPTPTPWPELYEGRVILIYGPDGEEVVQRAEIDSEGTYREELPPGTYVVDVERIGPISSPELPKTIEITSGETVQLDLTIDTGIR